MTNKELEKKYNEFKNKYNGKYIDFDGYYGAQCWDLAQYYMTEVLNLSADILNGCGNVKNMLIEPKLSVLKEYFDEVDVHNMQVGDVCIWTDNHIAIYDSYDGTNCLYFSQNPNECKVMIVNMNGHHAFRLKGLVIEEEQSEQPKEETTETSNDDILILVKKTIRGDFGNGEDRRNALGSNYDEVQRQVNLNCQNGTTNWDNVRLY